MRSWLFMGTVAGGQSFSHRPVLYLVTPSKKGICRSQFSAIFYVVLAVAFQGTLILFLLLQFGWTHVTLLIVVTQSHLVIHNLFEGMIWWVMTVREFSRLLCGCFSRALTFWASGSHLALHQNPCWGCLQHRLLGPSPEFLSFCFCKSGAGLENLN